MQSEAVKLAKIQSKTLREKAQIELLRSLASNPVVELIAGITAISYLNKGSQSLLESMTGIDLAAGGEFAGLITIIAIQQLSPQIPDIIKSAGGLAQALPAMLALTA